VSSTKSGTGKTRTTKKKTSTRNHYARGATFERTVRAKLYDAGALLVMKGGGSKCPVPKWFKKHNAKVDLIAIFPAQMNFPKTVMLVQAKSGKTKTPRKDLQELRRLSRLAGLKAFLAVPGRTLKQVKLLDVEEIDDE
jgi:hypothetical protein